jgi:hypothetical protein
MSREALQRVVAFEVPATLVDHAGVVEHETRAR